MKNLHSLLEYFQNTGNIKENRLVFNKSGAEKGTAEPPKKPSYAEMKEAKEGMTLQAAKDLADKAMKEFNDKVPDWTKADNGHSDKFKDIVKKAQTNLDTEKTTLYGLFTAAGVDLTKKMDSTEVKSTQDFGKKFEAKLAELETADKADRIEQKKEELKTKVADLNTKYTKTTVDAAIGAKIVSYTNALPEGATQKAVTTMVAENLKGFGSDSLKALEALSKKSADFDKKDAKVSEADLDALIKQAKEPKLFPDDVAKLWDEPAGVALDQQTQKFIKAVEAIVKGFEAIPSDGPATKAALKDVQPKIEKLIKKINDGKIAPSEIISERRQLETGVMIGYLKDVFKEDKEMQNVITSVFQTYALGKWNNKVDPAKVKLLLDKIQQDPVLSGKINIQLEGGADSAEFGLLESKWDTIYSQYAKAAGRLLALPTLQADPNVKANLAAITDISKIADKAGFVKFLKESNLAYLKSATGPFNTILAYMRMENVAGESLKNAADKPASIYLEAGKSGDNYRYSLVMTYNTEAAPVANPDPQAGAKAAPAPKVVESGTEPVVPKAGEVGRFFRTDYTVDKGRYTIIGSDPKYTQSLDETEFKAVTRKENPPTAYMEAKIATYGFSWLKGKPADLKYDPSTKTIAGTYKDANDNEIILSYSLQTGKVVAEIGGDVTPLLKDLSQDTLKEALRYGIDLKDIEPKDGDKDKALQEALKTGEWGKALEALAKATPPNYLLIVEVLKKAEVDTIKALTAEVKGKIEFSKVVENLKGQELDIDSYNKLIALIGKDPNTESLEGANMEAVLNLKLSAGVIGDLFGHKANRANKTLAGLYLREAFSKEPEYKDANIAAIVAYDGDITKLSDDVVTFVVGNFDAIKAIAGGEAKAKTIIDNYLSGADMLNLHDEELTAYDVAYDKLYDEKVIPASFDIWAKGMMVHDNHDVVSKVPLAVINNPNAAKYLDTWANRDDSIDYEGASVTDDQSVNAAKNVVKVLKTCTHPQNIDGANTLSNTIKAYLEDLTPSQEYKEGLSKEDAAKELYAIATKETEKDENRLLAINQLTGAFYKDLYQKDGADTPELTALKTTQAQLLYKTGEFDTLGEDNDAKALLPKAKQTFVDVTNALDADKPRPPTAYQLNELLDNAEEVGLDNLYSISQDDNLPGWQKMRIYEKLGLAGSAEPLKPEADTLEQDVYNALHAADDITRKATVDAAFTKFNAGAFPEKAIYEELMALGLDNGHTDEVIVSLKNGRNPASGKFIVSVFEKYPSITPADQIEIAKANSLYLTALELFEKHDGLTFSFENIERGIGASTISAEDVLKVISKANKKIDLGDKNHWDTARWCYDNRALIEKLDEPTRKIVYENLQTEREKVETYILINKKQLTKEEAAKIVALTDGGKRFNNVGISITTISADVAGEFAKFPEAGTLKFINVTTIDAVTAQALMAAKCSVSLKGLTIDAGDNPIMEALLTKEGGKLTLKTAAYDTLETYASNKGLEVYQKGSDEGYKIRLLAEMQEHGGLDLDLNGVNAADQTILAVVGSVEKLVGKEENETKARKAFADEIVAYMGNSGFVGEVGKQMNFLQECGFKKEESVNYTTNPASEKDKAGNAAVMKRIAAYLVKLSEKANKQDSDFKELPIAGEE